MLTVQGLRAEDIRWVGRTARARGEASVARDALLALVFLGQATKDEERLARELTDPAPDPVALDAPAERPGVVSAGVRSVSPVPDGPRMILHRDHEHGHPVARLVDTGAPATDQNPVLSPWRPGWERLPRSLADELSVCVLTRLARVHGVIEVTAAEPSIEPVAVVITNAVRRAGCPIAEVAQ